MKTFILQKLLKVFIMDKQAQSDINKIARRAKSTLKKLIAQIKSEKQANGTMKLEMTYSKSELYKFPNLSKGIVEKEFADMEAEGHVFGKNSNGIGYKISRDEVLKIYQRRGIKTFRKRKTQPVIATVANLKGGVTKSVSSVSIAHALRTHDSLICEDLRVLVIDLDPQGTATLLLSFDKSIGEVENTAVQAMIDNKLTESEIMTEFVVGSAIDGVDVLPANIGDAFIASDWDAICKEDLPGVHPYQVLQDVIIEKIKGNYDFILIDNGPHLDAFLENTLQVSDALLIPIPPSNVDLHSTCKFLERLPDLYHDLESKGVNTKLKKTVGFMTKFSGTDKEEDARSKAKDIFGGDLLDLSLISSKSFETSAETFDTVISVSRKNYEGDKRTLSKVQANVLGVARSIFDKLKNIHESEDE